MLAFTYFPNFPEYASDCQRELQLLADPVLRPRARSIRGYSRATRQSAKSTYSCWQSTLLSIRVRECRYGPRDGSRDSSMSRNVDEYRATRREVDSPGSKVQELVYRLAVASLAGLVRSSNTAFDAVSRLQSVRRSDRAAVYRYAFRIFHKIGSPGDVPGSGWPPTVGLLLTFFFVVRRNSLLLSITGISFERGLFYHKISAVSTTLLAGLHGWSHYRASNTSEQGNKQAKVVTGLVSFGGMVLLLVLSLNSIRDVSLIFSSERIGFSSLL